MEINPFEKYDKELRDVFLSPQNAQIFPGKQLFLKVRELYIFISKSFDDEDVIPSIPATLIHILFDIFLDAKISNSHRSLCLLIFSRMALFPCSKPVNSEMDFSKLLKILEPLIENYSNLSPRDKSRCNSLSNFYTSMVQTQMTENENEQMKGMHLINSFFCRETRIEAFSNILNVGVMRECEEKLIIMLKHTPQALESNTLFSKLTHSNLIVLEYDGKTSSQDFVTVLNLLQNINNVSAEMNSIFHIFPNIARFLDGNESEISSELSDQIVDHCMRVVEQCKRFGEIDNAGKLAIVECIRIFDKLCNLNSSLIPKLFGIVKNLYGVNAFQKDCFVMLQMIQFFINYSDQVVYDLESIIRYFFENIFSEHFTNPLFAFELLKLVRNNKERLLTHSNVFSLYFPPFFKILAWHGDSVFDDLFLDLFSVFVNRRTFVEIFHSILDLPLLAASFRSESAQSSSSLLEDSSSPSRLIMSYIFRNESGLSMNLWLPETTGGYLMEYCRTLEITHIVKCCPRYTCKLLEKYFHEIKSLCQIQNQNVSVVEDIIPNMFERYSENQLFPLSDFVSQVQNVLLRELGNLFVFRPSCAIHLKDIFIATIGVNSSLSCEKDMELILHILFYIGRVVNETSNPGISEDIWGGYLEALELLAFERMTIMRTSVEDSFIQSKFLEESSDGIKEEQLFSTRLMLLIVSTLSRLAASFQVVSSRVILCLSKLIGMKDFFHHSVLQHAEECISILKYPSVAAVILGHSSSAAFTDSNSALPFLLHPLTDNAAIQEDFHDFSLEHLER